MTKEDVLKLKAAVLYLLSKCEQMDFIHLFKILYFAERQQYAKYGQHLVKDTFCALELGPVPSFLYDAVKAVTGDSYKESQYIDILTSALASGSAECSHYMVRAKETPDMDELSAAEIIALDEAYSSNIKKDVSRISSDSHDEAWSSAWEKAQNSPMSPNLIAKAGGASEDFIKYIEDTERINSFLEE